MFFHFLKDINLFVLGEESSLRIPLLSQESQLPKRVSLKIFQSHCCGGALGVLGVPLLPGSVAGELCLESVGLPYGVWKRKKGERCRVGLWKRTRTGPGPDFVQLHIDVGEFILFGFHFLKDTVSISYRLRLFLSF